MCALTPHPSATESFEKFSQNERLRVLGDAKRNRLPVDARNSQQFARWRLQSGPRRRFNQGSISQPTSNNRLTIFDVQ